MPLTSLSLASVVKMKYIAATSALLASALAAKITSPPQITQCRNIAIKWTEGEGDIYITVIPAGNVAAEPLEAFPKQSGSTGTYNWKVNVPGGQKISLAVNDESGDVNYSSELTIRDSDDDDCLGKAAESGPASTDDKDSSDDSDDKDSKTSSSSSSSSKSSSSSSSSKSSPTSGSNSSSNNADSSAQDDDSGAISHAVAGSMVAAASLVGALLI